MKLFYAIFFALIALIYATSQPVIKHTRKEGCIEGTCGSHCEYDDVKLFPNEQRNQHGKCRMLKCTKEFDVLITPCPFDITGQYVWTKKPGDENKTYPDCCGTKTKRPNS